MLTLKRLILTAMLSLLPAVCHADDAVYAAHQFEIREEGSFVTKTAKEMDPLDFKGMLSVACTAFGCASHVTAMMDAAVKGVDALRKGPDFVTDASVVAHGDNSAEWRLQFDPPADYPDFAVCDAILMLNPAGLQIVGANVGDTNTGAIARNTKANTLAVYAVVPKKRGEGHWAFAQFLVKYVKKGTEAANNCQPDGKIIWHVGN